MEGLSYTERHKVRIKQKQEAAAKGKKGAKGKGAKKASAIPE